ncbi:MAG: glyceraldehyde-3-phosphate dehydrogenase [candidate division Zixibacteria bacterium SM23_81]|nr:MAG: glyceraldehyde-3-phosphate dehydrogenase [candidate division Zixibacteria bacterium SM23_81]
MAVRIAINGFGRIGRMVYRDGMKNSKLDIVAVNDLTDTKTLAHLLKYDSVHGVMDVEVRAQEGAILVGGAQVQAFAEKDPEKLPWGELGVDVVIESTGKFRSREDASKHLAAGAKKVMISAPGKGMDLTIVMGINHHQYDPSKHDIVSTASCTTNCFAPVVKVLNDAFGIVKGLMTTIHAYTNDQRILDFPHKDLRRARAAAMSMIPTTTGAAVATTLVLPELKGKLDGMAVRVPTWDGSMVDFVAELKKSVTREQVNGAIQAAAQGPLKGILEYTEDPIVSVDVIGNPHSSVFDGLSTMVMGGNMVKVVSWYDNERAYALRMVELAEHMLR